MKKLSLIILMAVLTALLPVSVLYAQDATEEPTPEATEEAPDVVVVIEPDYFTPIVDSLIDNARDFLNSAGVVMAFIATFLIAIAKWVFPKRQFDAHQIALTVLISFSVLFALSQLGGFTDQLQRGVDFLSALAEPLKQILFLFGGSTALWEVSKWLGVPLLGDKQGDKAFSLEPR